MSVPRARAGTAVFLLVAFGGSWGLWIPLAFAGVEVRPGGGWPSHLPGLLAPAAGAFAGVWVMRGMAGVRDLTARLVRWRPSRTVTVVLAATIIAAIGAAVVGAAAGESLDYSGAPAWGVFTVVYALVVNGFGEETGWRGFLADTLIDRTSNGVAAVVVWIVWGIWHLPLFFVVENLNELGVGGTVGWAVGLLSGSILLLWMYIGGHRSVLIVAIWHTAFNYTAATGATAGVIAAIASTAVIILSVPIIARPSWWRRNRTAGEGQRVRWPSPGRP